MFQHVCQSSDHTTKISSPLFHIKCISPLYIPYTDYVKDDDELGESPYLAGFEWDREECYTKFIVHQKRTGEEKPAGSGGKKSKKNKGDKIEE